MAFVIEENKEPNEKLKNFEILQPIWEKVVGILLKANQTAVSKGKPLLVLAPESHQGFREFISKCILSAAASRVGIHHHTIERQPGQIFSDLQNKDWKDAQLFEFFLSQMDGCVSEIDRKYENDGLREIFENKHRAEEERKALREKIVHYINLRNKVMADQLVFAGLSAILYHGMGHLVGLYQLLKDHFHIVIFDVTNLTVKDIQKTMRQFEQRTGFSYAELGMSFEFIFSGVKSGLIHQVRLPFKEPVKIEIREHEIVVINDETPLIRKPYEIFGRALNSLWDFFESNGRVFPVVSLSEFNETRLNKPILWDMSFKKQKKDAPWVQEAQRQIVRVKF